MNTLTAIIVYGLSIRQIPQQTRRLYDPRHMKQGLELVTIDGIKYAQQIKIPKHAGYWMCKQITSTSAQVVWNTKTDNIAPTLKESVDLFLATQPEYKSQAARDCQKSGFGGKSYWDYLDQHAQEMSEQYIAKGDEQKAKDIMNRSICVALRGNDGI